MFRVAIALLASRLMPMNEFDRRSFLRAALVAPFASTVPTVQHPRPAKAKPNDSRIEKVSHTSSVQGSLNGLRSVKSGAKIT